MVDLVRRRLLRGSAAGAGLAALGLPGAALAQLAPVAKLTDIDHIIVLMRENRSFDHYFGTLCRFASTPRARALNACGR